VWWAWPGAVVLGLLAGVVLSASVAPRASGRLFATGCAPCAVVPAAAVLGVLVLLDSTATAGGMLTAVTLLAVVLLQRRVPTACSPASPGLAEPDA
jgi:hypothetical protein